MSIYDTDLDQGPHNSVALSPLSLIARTAHVYPEAVAIRYGAPELSLIHISEPTRPY